MRVVKVLNNSLVLALDEQGQETILMGKGIGFHKASGYEFGADEVEKVFVLRDRSVARSIIRLAAETDTEFLLDLMRLTALVGDSHTSVSLGGLADFRGYPFSLVRRGESWYLSAAAPEDKDLLCQEVTLLAGKPVEEVIEAYGTLFASDNPVHLRRSFRQACNVADIYEYLGLVEAGKPLTVTLKGGKALSLAPVGMEEMNKLEIVRISDKIKGQPETAAADAYYLAKPLTEDVYYIQYNTCREAEDLPMEDFAALVAKDLKAGDYSRVLLDLRNNGGGSDGVIWPLFEVLRESMDGGAKLVGLIGEATFSSALINAVEIQEMGGVLAGEPAGGSVCHFGAVQTFSLPNSKVRGQLSSKYLDLNTLLDAAAGRGVVALEPDVLVYQTLEDTLKGKDTLADWCLAAPDQKLVPAVHDNAPLTRGRFIGQLYEAAGSPDVEIGEELPFKDSFGIEWYLPAMAWAKEQGMIDDSFDGNTPCTRAAAVHYIWQAKGQPAAAASSFTDVDANAAYAKAVDWANETKITTGTGDGTRFEPNTVCSRAYIVTFLYRALAG